MEFASKLRWAVVITIVLLTLVLFGWGLYSIANNLFRGDSDSATQSVLSDSAEYELLSARTVSYTVDGPVVANEDHRSYTIDVSRNVVTMKVYAGYGETIIEQKSYQNTDEAYETFLKALEYANATARMKGTTEEDDTKEQGVCASGRRYILEVDSDIRRWSTSCSIEQGTAKLHLRRNVESLFQKQVPDFSTLRSGTGI